MEYVELKSKDGFDLIEPAYINTLIESMRNFDGVFYDVINCLTNIKSDAKDALLLRGGNPLYDEIVELESFYRDKVLKITDSFKATGLVDKARAERNRILDAQTGEIEYIKNKAIAQLAEYQNELNSSAHFIWDPIYASVRKVNNTIDLCNKDLETINKLRNSDSNDC